MVVVTISRLLRHLLSTDGRVRRAFPRSTLQAIEAAVTRSEALHAAEIRVVIEGALHGRALLMDTPARERALEAFSQLRVWDTEHNNGVLIHVLWADRSVEIVADRGAHAKVGDQIWQQTCRQIEEDFGSGQFERGLLRGIEFLTVHLAQHYPPSDQAQGRELPDAPMLI
jgi:uncharacterized membrane protein